MKCEICHNAEAKTAIHKEVDGKMKELYVCLDCAHAASESKPKDDTPIAEISFGNGAKGVLNFEGITPPKEVVEDIFKHLLQPAMEASQEILANPTLFREKGAPCPKCGMLPDDYKRIGRLGCDQCYKAFARQLGPVIRDMHPGVSHVGKVPRQEMTKVDKTSLRATKKSKGK